MARYKPVDTQPEFVAIDLAAQLLPGTFEHALHHLLEQAIDLTPFDARYRNDTTGAPAYAPGMLLRVVLFAYSRGIISSRAIARACEEQVTFIALSGDSRPHFTTIAHFVSTLGDQIAPIFAAVLAVCDRQGLIGREMFAIDGVKLPSNASKHRSGTRADFERQATKMERAADAMLARHRAEDARDVEPSLAACMNDLVLNLSQVANAQSGETLRRAGRLQSDLKYGRIDEILATGLHAYLTQFLDRVGDLGVGISRDFLVPMAA